MKFVRTVHLCFSMLGTSLRSVVRVREASDGDLMLDLLPATKSRALRVEGRLAIVPTEDPAHGRSIQEARISIHMSRHSMTANRIKFTQRTEAGVTETANITEGIKVTDTFTPVVMLRYDDLRQGCYDLPPEQVESATLADIAVPQLFTTFVGIFVGDKGRDFHCPTQDDYGYRELDFGYFRLLVLWSFLCAAPRGGHEIHATTTEELGPQSMKDDADCVAFFKTARLAQREELLRSYLSGGWRDIHGMAAQSPFFREARSESPEFQAFTQAFTGALPKVNGEPMLTIRVPPPRGYW